MKEITVFYKWTAKPGKLDELKAVYKDVYKAMEENEPDSLKMECYFDDEQNAIIVHDVFKNGEALGFHLMGTAAQHFPQLAEIAMPGPFIFYGDVPENLKQAAIGMNMGAEFSAHAFGFERNLFVEIWKSPRIKAVLQIFFNKRKSLEDIPKAFSYDLIHFYILFYTLDSNILPQ